MRGNIVVEIGNSNENENARLIEAEIGRMRDGSTKRCTYCTVEMRYFKFLLGRSQMKFLSLKIRTELKD